MSYVMDRIDGFSSFSRLSKSWQMPSIAAVTVS